MEYLTQSPWLENALSWLAGISFFTFLLSLLLIPFIVGLLAPDYFLKFREKRRSQGPLSARTLLLLIVRNFLGVLLMLAGFAMLFLPGQGLLTILLGILLLTLPGKYRLVNRLAGYRSIRRSLNWLRKKEGKQPFIWPDSKRDDNSA